jgi:Flp pilus assembly protein TadG
MIKALAALHPDTRGNSIRKAASGASRRDGHGLGKPRSSMTGAVTAEFAVALPAVLLLLALLLSGAAAGVTQLRLEEAALAGARALARGEDAAAAEGIVRTLAGTSAAVSVVPDGEWLHVTVADRVGGPLAATLPWTLTAKASSRSEMPRMAGPPRQGRPSQSLQPLRVTNLNAVPA